MKPFKIKVFRHMFSTSRNMHAHLLTLAKMATLPKLIQNCFKRKKSASGVITSMFNKIYTNKPADSKVGVNGKIKMK